MTQVYYGYQIEKYIKKHFNMQDSDIGFDATWHNRPVEIKSCKEWHSNGVTKKGKDRKARGRFWINNKNHQILLNENGIYVFVVYEKIEDILSILYIRFIDASIVDLKIGKGKNTKLNWKRMM